MKRVKEASVRKVLGAKRFNLVKQFLGESLLIALAAFALSLILFRIFQPYYVQLAGQLPEAGLVAAVIAGVFILTLVTGVIGGSYPAIRLSSLNLADAPKGGGKIKSKHRLQNILTVVQFTCSVFLIVCTIATTSQLALMRKIDLGFNKEHILLLPAVGKMTAERTNLLKQRLQNLTGVTSVTASSAKLGGGVTGNGYFPEGMENSIMIKVIDVDEDFLDLYGINLHAGRFFSGNEQDKTYYVVNEALAKTFGWNDDAIGKTIDRSGRHEIIGIVSDFNFAPLYEQIQPLIIANDPWQGRFSCMSVKYHSANHPSVLVSNVEKVWNEINPDIPFEYEFFDEHFNSLYKMEVNFRSLFAVFAVIAIILASLGVLSLMAYATEQRKKEIGIRKVLGASVGEVLTMLLKQTGIQVLVANMLAWPLAWWVVRMGLDNFVYRISIGPLIFIAAFVLSALAALLAVGFQAIKAATANPIDAIKSE
jgi:putative ABC transport system permease protein